MTLRTLALAAAIGAALSLPASAGNGNHHAQAWHGGGHGHGGGYWNGYRWVLPGLAAGALLGAATWPYWGGYGPYAAPSPWVHWCPGVYGPYAC